MRWVFLVIVAVSGLFVATAVLGIAPNPVGAWILDNFGSCIMAVAVEWLFLYVHDLHDDLHFMQVRCLDMRRTVEQKEARLDYLELREMALTEDLRKLRGIVATANKAPDPEPQPEPKDRFAMLEL